MFVWVKGRQPTMQIMPIRVRDDRIDDSIASPNTGIPVFSSPTPLSRLTRCFLKLGSFVLSNPRDTCHQSVTSVTIALAIIFPIPTMIVYLGGSWLLL